MQPPMPSPTATWRNDTYPAISPERPELSVAGKTVVITGGGSGIGRETAMAFARAGANRIVLLGRTESSLRETAALLPSTVSSMVHPVNICEVKAVRDVAASIGTWDVLVLAAGYFSNPSPIASADIDDWWQSVETNVKGTFVCAQAFLPTRNETRSVVLALSSGLASALPASMVPASSAYFVSKLAMDKMVEFLASENPDVFAATVHPGFVETAIFNKSGAQASTLPMDKVQLSAHFLVWMASAEAEFLKGRVVWANWDVSELKAQAETIASGRLITVGLTGWPFHPGV